MQLYSYKYTLVKFLRQFISFFFSFSSFSLKKDNCSYCYYVLFKWREYCKVWKSWSLACLSIITGDSFLFNPYLSFLTESLICITWKVVLFWSSVLFTRLSQFTRLTLIYRVFVCWFYLIPVCFVVNLKSAVLFMVFPDFYFGKCSE